MKVILTQDTKNLGQKWDIVEVKTGYFRNFLLPQGAALMPTQKLMAEAEAQMAARAKKSAEIEAKAQEIKTELASTTLKFARKATEAGDTLYVGLHKKDIAEALKEQAKLDIDAKKINLKKDIKAIGEHVVNVQLSDSVSADVKILVEAE